MTKTEIETLVNSKLEKSDIANSKILLDALDESNFKNLVGVEKTGEFNIALYNASIKSSVSTTLNILNDLGVL